MILRSSTSIWSAQLRTSSSGLARIRRSSASNAWPVPKMPTLDCVAAGSMPRSVSSAFARIAARCTASESDGLFGYRAPKCSCIAGIHFAYRSNAPSMVAMYLSRSGPASSSAGT